jgi:alpha-L-arabinofuranosidase
MKAKSNRTISRRQSIGLIAGGISLAATQPTLTLRAQVTDAQHIALDPAPRFKLSPYLYMQFMEPLGATDGSIEAAWDHLRDEWRADVVEVTRELAPTMMRWGGIFGDFYRWREGVGPRDKRPPMLNLLWGGIESNQIGTTEFVDFSRRVGAEPLVCVNFESDGRRRYMKAKGSVRTGDAKEAAEWVSYCNDPDSAERRAHGRVAQPAVKYWQIGNETSYDKLGFDIEAAARKTVEFATAMRRADPSIQLIGWGDSGWAARMIEVAGEHLQFLAFHHMFNPDSEKQPVLRGESYRRDAEATWQQLMKAWEITDAKIRLMREQRGRHQMPLALTECHFAIPGRDRGDVNSTWATGVSYARILNNHQRHGDVLKIATAADFCGTRWQNNAVMIPVPQGQGRAYLQPVARVMKLYRHHIGGDAITVKRTPGALDIAASRSGDTVFLHVVNTERTRAVKASFQIEGHSIQSGRVFEIADDPVVEVTYLNSAEVMRVIEKPMRTPEMWEFPAASVSAVELTLTNSKAIGNKGL